MDPKLELALDLAAKIGDFLFKMVSTAIAARSQELDALNARLADTLATMRGERTAAHAAVAASDAALRAELEALKEEQAVKVGAHKI